MSIIEFSNQNKYGNLRTRRFYHPTSNFGINPKGLGPTVIVKLHKYKHNHGLPPSITKLNNKTYIVPGWQEVIEGTTLNDIIHIRPKTKQPIKPIIVKTLSSKGDITYTTKYFSDSDKFSCTCPGVWMSKNNCKHIKKLRNEQR